MEVGAVATSCAIRAYTDSTPRGRERGSGRCWLNYHPQSRNAPSLLCLSNRNRNRSFLGDTHSLQLHGGGDSAWCSWILHRAHGGSRIRAAAEGGGGGIRRFKERSLDKVIESQKKLKLVAKIKQILLKQPEKKMSMRELGKYRKQLGLLERRRIIPILRRYPAVFEVYEEEAFSMYCRLSPQAEQLHLEELHVKSQMEDLLVHNLRKLLMMSSSKRILLEKIAHVATDIGLPMDFRTNLCKRYPQFFTVVETDYGLALELTCWDPALAVSAAEKKAQEEAQNPDPELILDRPRKFKKIQLPKGYSLSRKHRNHILKFQEIPFISPYSDCKSFDPASMESEKHACAVVHEFLTLTVEKKTLVDHLTHFRHDFKFPNKLRAMLLRHPELFYVSFKGQRDSVFLREAYQGPELIEKHKSPLMLIQEKLHSLMLMGRRQTAQSLEDQDVDDYDGIDNIGSGDEWSDSEQVEQEPRLAPQPHFSATTIFFEAPTETELPSVGSEGGVSRDCW